MGLLGTNLTSSAHRGLHLPKGHAEGMQHSLEEAKIMIGTIERTIDKLDTTSSVAASEEMKMGAMSAETEQKQNTAAREHERADIATSQQMEINELKQKVEALTKDRSNLEKRVGNLREQNISLAKKLASRRWNRRSFYSEEGTISHKPDDEDLKGSIAALDLLLLSKDEEIDELTSRQKASNELIVIMRDQITCLQREKTSAIKAVLQDKEKVERKNAALKSSVEHCDATIERMRKQVVDLKSSANEAIAKAEEERKQSEQHLKAELSKEKEKAHRTITELEQKLLDVSNELRESAVIAKMTAARKEEERKQSRQLFVAKLEEERQKAQHAISDLEQKLHQATQHLQRVQEENDVLRDSPHHSGSWKQHDLSEEFIIYQPVVKNLSFLLEMKERALKKMKSERDEAWKEVEKKSLHIEQLNQRLTEEDGCRMEASKSLLS